MAVVLAVLLVTAEIWFIVWLTVRMHWQDIIFASHRAEARFEETAGIRDAEDSVR